MRMRLLIFGVVSAIVALSPAHAQFGTSSGNTNNLVPDEFYFPPDEFYFPRFRNYPSYRFVEDVPIGAPGAVYYDVPAAYGVRRYRYVVRGRPAWSGRARAGYWR